MYQESLIKLNRFVQKVHDTSVHADKSEAMDRDGLNFINFQVKDPHSIALGDRQQDAVNFRFYVFYTSLIWRRAVFEDECHILGSLEESPLGHPYRIRQGQRLISQDLARSATEYNLLKGRLGKSANGTILEIGAGYGRLAEVFLQRGASQYIIVDIFPMIYLAEQYLKARFPNSKIFSLRDFSDFQSVAREIEQARIVFLTPDQLRCLPDRYVDVAVNINSFMEIAPAEVESYFAAIERLAKGHFYTKQWLLNKSKQGVHGFEKSNYPARPHWSLVVEREDPLHSDFFEQIWKIA